MEKDDLTVRVLIEIRDRLDQTNSRLDQTNSRLEHMRDDLCERIDHLDLRMSTEMTAVAGAVNDVGRLLKMRRKDQGELHARIDRVEKDVADLKKRVG